MTWGLIWIIALGAALWLLRRALLALALGGGGAGWSLVAACALLGYTAWAYRHQRKG